MNIKGKKRVRRNNPAERLKSYYATSHEVTWFHNFGDESSKYEFTSYPDIKNHCFRSFSTLQERSLFVMHTIEHKREYGLKLRGKRSARNLPDSYDDLHSNVYNEKCWKNRSKRKRQHYR